MEIETIETVATIDEIAPESENNLGKDIAKMLVVSVAATAIAVGGFIAVDFAKEKFKAFKATRQAKTDEKIDAEIPEVIEN